MMFPIEKVAQKSYIYCSIFSLSNRLQLIGDRRCEDISTKQSFVLANVALFDDYTLNLKDTAQLVGTSSQNVKKIVSILENKGYVTVAKDERDGRNRRIALTEKGKAYYAHRVKQEELYMEELFEGFDDNSVSELYKGLRNLMDNAIKKQGEN